MVSSVLALKDVVTRFVSSKAPAATKPGPANAAELALAVVVPI